MRRLKGGKEINLAPVPVERYAYNYGGSDSDNAAKMMIERSLTQNSMNNALSGGRRIKRGGSYVDNQTSVEIPQFATPGINVSSQNASSSSLNLNSTLINARMDALNDDMVGQTGGKRRRRTVRRKSRGGKRKHKRETKRKYKKSKARRYKHRR